MAGELLISAVIGVVALRTGVLNRWGGKLHAFRTQLLVSMFIAGAAAAASEFARLDKAIRLVTIALYIAMYALYLCATWFSAAAPRRVPWAAVPLIPVVHTVPLEGKWRYIGAFWIAVLAIVAPASLLSSLALAG